MNWQNWIIYKSNKSKPAAMESQNNENTAYVDFVQNLNRILNNYDINQLNCS